MIVTQSMLFTTTAAKCGDTFQIADHTRAIINIVRTAFATSMQCALIDMATFIANCDAHVDAEIIAAGVCCNIKQR